LGPLERSNSSNATHSHEASCCQTLTEGPAAKGKRKGSAINALQIAGGRYCSTASSAPARVANKSIGRILPAALRCTRRELKKQQIADSIEGSSIIAPMTLGFRGTYGCQKKQTVARIA